MGHYHKFYSFLKLSLLLMCHIYIIGFCFLIFYFRGIQQSLSRESPATLFTVEDEVDKTLNRKKSFFKKASKSSILTVIFFQFRSESN